MIDLEDDYVVDVDYDEDRPVKRVLEDNDL